MVADGIESYLQFLTWQMSAFFVRIILAIGLLATGALRAAELAGVVLIANEGVRVERVSASALKDIYTGRTAYWGDGQKIVLAVLAGQTDAALKEVTGMDPSQFNTFWQRLVFSGRGQQPKKLEDAAALVALVAATKGAIALVPEGVPRPGVKIVDIK